MAGRPVPTEYVLNGKGRASECYCVTIPPPLEDGSPCDTKLYMRNYIGLE